jgi:hypothetical protein
MTQFKNNFSLIPSPHPFFTFSSQQSKTQRLFVYKTTSTEALAPFSPRKDDFSCYIGILNNNTLAFTLLSRTTCPAVTLRPDTVTSESSGQLFRPRYVTHKQMPSSSNYTLSPCEGPAKHCSPTVLSIVSIDLRDETEQVDSCVGAKIRGSPMLARIADELHTSYEPLSCHYNYSYNYNFNCGFNYHGIRFYFIII